MTDETATPPTSGEPAPRPRKRQPRNPEQRERAAKRSAVRRLLKKLERAGDSDELFRLLEEERAEASPPPAADPTPPSEPAQTGEVLEPGQRPGWPAPSVVAQHVPMSRDLWTQVAARAAGTRYAECLARREVILEVPVFDGAGEQTATRKEVVTYDPTETLAQATAPVVAAELPHLATHLATTPAAALVISVAMVVGPTAAAHLWEVASDAVQRWWRRRHAGGDELATVTPIERASS